MYKKNFEFNVNEMQVIEDSLRVALGTMNATHIKHEDIVNLLASIHNQKIWYGTVHNKGPMG